MKKFLKRAAALAALVLALACFAGCKNNGDSDDYTVEGPWVEVTNLDDLVGTWIYRDKGHDEGEELDDEDGLEYAGKTYAGKWIAEWDSITEWKIESEDEEYKVASMVDKKGSWDKEIFVFKTPLTTDAEVAAVKAAVEAEEAELEENKPNAAEKCTITVTKTRIVWTYNLIKDDDIMKVGEDLVFKIDDDGKCYGYDKESKDRYIEINEAKNGIRIYDVSTNESGEEYFELYYTLKKK